MTPELESRSRLRASESWREQGCPEGRAREHWEQAERELAGPRRRSRAKQKGPRGWLQAGLKRGRDRDGNLAKSRVERRFRYCHPPYGVRPVGALALAGERTAPTGSSSGILERSGAASAG